MIDIATLALLEGELPRRASAGMGARASFGAVGGLGTIRAQPVAEENNASPVNPSRVPWLVTAVEAQDGFRLKVRFIDGAEGIVEMGAFVRSSKSGVFSVLADPLKFAEVYIEHDAVAWPGDLDLAPDAMHRAIRETGRWILT